MPRGIYIRSEEFKNKMHLIAKSRPPISKETKQKMSDVGKGRVVTEETKRKISDRNKGKIHSEQSKYKMRLSKIGKHPKRSKHSEETKQKMSLSKKGKKHSEETKQKMSLLKIGKHPKHPKHSDETKQKISLSQIGELWYGAVTYPKPDNTCLLWNDVNKRSHIFYENRCVICGKIHKSNAGHHVFYERQACCMISNNGEYYTNLNAKDHPLKDYYIGKNPNYFVILCRSCHSKTNGGFKNREKWANYFRELIDTQYNGKSFLTKEEYKEYIKNIY
jgi:hypothetical protein